MVKENYLSNYMTNAMDFHSVLTILLSSVATSHLHLRIEISYHNTYVIPEPAADSLYRAKLLEQGNVATR